MLVLNIFKKGRPCNSYQLYISSREIQEISNKESANSESGPWLRSMRDVYLEHFVAILDSDVLHTAREVFPSMDEDHIHGSVRVLVALVI